MIIAEITVIPIGTETPGVGLYVARAVKELRKLGLNPQVTAMSTIFEAEEISIILEAFRAVHESVFAQGAQRVVTTLTIDERRDKEGSRQQKIRSVTSVLE